MHSYMRRHHRHRRRPIHSFFHPLVIVVFCQMSSLVHGLSVAHELDTNTSTAKQTALINPNLEAAIRGLNNNQSLSTATANTIPSEGILNELMELPAGKSNHTNQTSSSILVGDKELVVNEEDGESPFMIGIIIANIVIFIIGLCGNAIVILVILKFTRIETVTDIYILNLALADIMFLTGLAFLMITMTLGHWIFGNFMCKVYMATTSLNQFASSLLLVVMSFDRFLAVCHPIYAQRFRRIKRAKIICLGIWIICIILMSPIFSFAKISKDTTQLISCVIYWPEYSSINCEKAFTIYSFAIGFAVPLLLIAAFYNSVLNRLRLAATGQLGLASSRRSRSRESANRRIEHLVIGIICTYTICWLPYWIGQIGLSFTPSNPPIFPYEYFMMATCLSYTNSALNPILYAFLSDNFKRRCTDIFRSICSIKLIRIVRDARAVSTGNGGSQSTAGGFLTVHNNPMTTATSLCCELSEMDRVEARPLPPIDESVRLVQRFGSANNNIDETETDQFVRLCNQEELETNSTKYGLNPELTSTNKPTSEDNERRKSVVFGINTIVSRNQHNDSKGEQAISNNLQNSKRKLRQYDNKYTKPTIRHDV